MLLRSAALGASVGAVIGGVVGTPAFPLVGTAIVAVAGSAIGAAIGLVNGLVLLGLSRFTASSSSTIRLACALTTFGCCLVLRQLIIAIGCATLAGALGPVLAHGARPVDLGRRFGRRELSVIVGTALAVGAVIGAVIGGAVGLVVGLASYLPTAPFAAVEGALFGVAIGGLIALVGTAVFVAPRLRAIR